ncbi:MAG: transglutaminase-like cysteine peptidase [Parvibaculum sp.]|nr:transglutaminase-like cysteine peptidase [Parvibaculum sp.]
MFWCKRIVVLAGIAAGLAGCETPDRVGSIGSSFFDNSAGVHLVVAAMPEGQQVMAPYGYIGFCVRNPDECGGGTDAPKDAALTPESWAELNKVNNYVNNTVPQVSDYALYDRAEWWAYPDANGGDCEDFALMKRKLLIERGWAAENLLVAVVREWNGEGHAVLVVKTDRGEFVLDNKNWEIVAWSDAPYQWIKRQSRERPYIWVNLDRRTFRDVAQAALPPVGEPAPFLAAIQKKTPQPALDMRPGVNEGQTASRDISKEEPTAALALN